MTRSRLFGFRRPRRPHILRGGGRASEIADLRNDIDSSFLDIEKVLTADGGFAVPLINDTGSNSVKGTIVEASTTDFACKVADANSDHNIGVMYSDGVADGETVYIVVQGIAYVLMKDTLDATASYWVGVSDVAGRAYMVANTPALAADHNKEVGHCVQSVTGGSDVLAAIMVHQN